jgi:hypothetical protein
MFPLSMTVEHTMQWPSQQQRLGEFLLPSSSSCLPFFDETGGDKTPTDYMLKRTKKCKIELHQQTRKDRKEIVIT